MPTITGNQSSNVSGTKFIDSRCIVEFRPADEWKGEYGFDWFRRGDTIENVNGRDISSNYTQLVGKYVPDDPDCGKGVLERMVSYSHGNRSVEVDCLDSLCKEYASFIIKGYSRRYYAPFLSLYFQSLYKYRSEIYLDMLAKKSDGSYYIRECCKTTANVKLLINAKNIKAIAFSCGDALSVSPNVIRNIPNGESTNQITITLNYRFSGEDHQAIKVFAYHRDGVTKTFAGQINIVRCIPRKVNVCFVNVEIMKGDSVILNGYNFTQSSTYSKNLKKFLAQAHVIPSICFRSLSVYSNDAIITNHLVKYNNNYVLCRKGKDGVDISARLENIFNKRHPQMASLYKVFFLGLDGLGGKVGSRYYLAGHANGIPSKSLVIYKNPEESVVCHEILHCFGLYHSFSNKSNHTFIKKHTSNIMDYSEDTISLWRWQWDKIAHANGVVAL